MCENNVVSLLAARMARCPKQLSPEEIIRIHVARELRDLPSQRISEAQARAARNVSAMSPNEALRRACAWARSAFDVNDSPLSVA